MPQKSVQVSYLNVGPDEAGQRIDNWLMARLKGVPRSLVYRIIRSGEVRVNKGRAKPRQRLESGDVVRVPPVRMDESDGPVPIPEAMQQKLAAQVLYRSDDVLVINKPPGLAVHSGSGVRYGLIDVARVLWGDDWQLVHRLDRETSGCLLLVRRRELQREFQAAHAENRVHKAYLALVHGAWPQHCTRLETTLQKAIDHSGEHRIRDVDSDEEGGRVAVSHFNIEQSYRAATLLRVELETGRTHQIRVQTSSAGHPIVGDDKYGRRAFDQALGLAKKPSLCLHAQHLRLELGGELVDVHADVPQAYLALLAELEALS